MGAKVEIFLDLSKFGDILADNVTQRVAADVKNKARRNVRVDTGRLRNSIRVDGVGFAVYEVVTDTPHSLAQEFGRPDLPNYGFTPYLRPAAQQAAKAENIAKIVAAATQVALSRSKG